MCVVSVYVNSFESYAPFLYFIFIPKLSGTSASTMEISGYSAIQFPINWYTEDLFSDLNEDLLYIQNVIGLSSNRNSSHNVQAIGVTNDILSDLGVKYRSFKIIKR